MWTIFKIFIEFVTILLLFSVLVSFFFVFGHEACGISAPRQGVKPAPTALEGEVLTPGLSGKSLDCSGR